MNRDEVLAAVEEEFRAQFCNRSDPLRTELYNEAHAFKEALKARISALEPSDPAEEKTK